MTDSRMFEIPNGAGVPSRWEIIRKRMDKISICKERSITEITRMLQQYIDDRSPTYSTDNVSYLYAALKKIEKEIVDIATNPSRVNDLKSLKITPNEIKDYLQLNFSAFQHEEIKSLLKA